MARVVGVEDTLVDNKTTGRATVSLRHPDVDENDLAPGLWKDTSDRSVADDDMAHRVGLEDGFDHLVGVRVIGLGEGPVPQRTVRVAGHACAGVDAPADSFVELIQ